ncbi:MAG: phosphomethylpyrimidine synthase ThiC [Bryobacterales bacterium]
MASGYDHITSAIGAAMIGWHGAAMRLLRHAQRAPGPAEQGRRQTGPDQATRLPPMRPTSPATALAWRLGRQALQGALRVRLGEAPTCRLDPETARAYHDETSPEEGYKSARSARCAARTTAR